MLVLFSTFGNVKIGLLFWDWWFWPTKMCYTERQAGEWDDTLKGGGSWKNTILRWPKSQNTCDKKPSFNVLCLAQSEKRDLREDFQERNLFIAYPLEMYKPIGIPCYHPPTMLLPLYYRLLCRVLTWNQRAIHKKKHRKPEADRHHERMYTVRLSAVQSSAVSL